MKKVIRFLLMIVGSISLVLGIIGIILPLVPTTPFLLLAAACYVRSSERLYTWLMTNKWFGSYIKNYKAGKGIPLRVKIMALIIIWSSMLYSAIFIAEHILLRIGFIFGACFFTVVIFLTKTLNHKDEESSHG